MSKVLSSSYNSHFLCQDLNLLLFFGSRNSSLPPSPSLLLLLMWTRPMDSPSLPLLLRRNKMTIFSLFCPPPSPLRGATVLLSAAFHWAHVGVLGEGWDSGRASTERSKSILAFRKVNGKSGLTLERCFALFAKKDFSFQNILYMLLSYTFICSSICMLAVEKRKNKEYFLYRNTTDSPSLYFNF